MIIIMPFLISTKLNPSYLMAKVVFIYVLGTFLLIVLIKDNFTYLKLLIKKPKLFKLKKENFSKATFKKFFSTNLEEKGILCMFISYTIFTIIGPAFFISLLGNRDRYEGLLIYGIYFLLFIAAKKYMKVNKVMLDIILITSSIMAILTIFQLHNIDPIYSFLSGTNGAYSEFGTIGNRNFLSTYLLIFEVIALGAFIFFNKKRYLIYSSIIFAGILSGQTRGVWIGFIIMALTGLIFSIKNKKQLFKMVIVVICFTGILLGLNYTSKGEILGRFNTLTDDVATIVDPSNHSKDDEKNPNSDSAFDKLGSGRGKIWSMTARSIMMNPFIGTGPDTLDRRLIRDLEDEFIYMKYIKRTLIDKAHNEYLEYAATGGISALLGYLAIVLSILTNLIRKKKDAISKIFFLIIVGYLAQATFNISVIQVAPIYWIVLGLATKHYRSKDGILELHSNI